MNWEIIRNPQSSLQEYRLTSNNNCKVILKYNPRHQSVRATSDNNHRLFFLETTGSLSDKIIFKNEYGIEVGNLVYDKLRGKHGSALIDQKKYHYEITEEELLIYTSDLTQVLIRCSLQSTPTLGSNISSLNFSHNDIRCMILGLCWFLVLPVTNIITDYATETLRSSRYL